jgi:UDP-glucuronate decarboxylase
VITPVDTGPPDIVREDVDRICKDIRGALGALRGSTILVAGGEGFLPSYIVDALLHANAEGLDPPCHVISVDNRSTADPTRLAHLAGRADFELVVHDVTTPIVIRDKVDYIVHGASIASPSWYRERPLETIDVNVGGTRHLLELAREHDVMSFLYLSSSEIYGDPPHDRVPTTEDYWGHVSSTGPRACYDESKRLAETLCMTYFRLYETPVTIVRPFNVYGPRLRLDDGRVVPDFVRDALRGDAIRVLSDGRVTRSFCYVRDAVAVMLLLLTSAAGGEAFNVGNDEEVTIAELAAVVAQESGSSLGITYGQSDDPAYLVDNPSRRAPDLVKVHAATGWQPSVSLREGIARTIAHYRAAGEA